ncbi:unnamed protein product [Closterium sp. Naga37s-1]|nr:unnamed protein product [Closterium sp. Naga37s-1]
MWRVACREARKQVASLTHGPACRGAHGGPYPLHSLAHAAPPSAATPHHARLIPSLVVPRGPASLAANATRIGAWRHASPLALTLTSPSLSALRSALTHSSATLSSATLSAAASLPATARASIAVPAAGAAAGRAAGVSVWKHYGRCYYELSKTRLRWVGRGSVVGGRARGGGELTRPVALDEKMTPFSFLPRVPHLISRVSSTHHKQHLPLRTAFPLFPSSLCPSPPLTPVPLCPLPPASCLLLPCARASYPPARRSPPSLLVVATAAAGFVMGSGDHVEV